MTNYIIPILIIVLILFSLYKKINIYETFSNGAKKSFNLIYNIFPYVFSIMLVVALFRASGLGMYLVKFLSPIFNCFNIPVEVCELVLLRPFTGSGSISLLKDVIIKYGADSYISRCACCILSSSETLFYVVSIYFANKKTKKVYIAILIALLCNFIGAILSCLLCKII